MLEKFLSLYLKSSRYPEAHIFIHHLVQCPRGLLGCLIDLMFVSHYGPGFEPASKTIEDQGSSGD